VPTRFEGLVAATFTPMLDDGSLWLEQVGPMVDFLAAAGVRGLYVCGSTGEGPLLTLEERKATADAFVQAARGRVPVVVQVGHSSLAAARELATHAASIEADAISAVPPYYFKPPSVGVLVDCLTQIAAGAPDLPFYYYHIPALSGVGLDMVELLRRAPERVPSLVGVKYTAPTLDEVQQLIELDGRRFEILFGRDEMLLSALAAGARAAVGSTYNFAAPLYRRIVAAFDAGERERAQKLQGCAVRMVRTILGHAGQAGLKAAMGFVGPDCGPVRLPLVSPTPDQTARLREELQAIGFFEWCSP